MGVNECGLIIGNEAEGSRCEGEKEEGLLGMDLLRLALETGRYGPERRGCDHRAAYAIRAKRQCQPAF